MSFRCSVEIGSIRKDSVCDCNVNYSIYDCNDQLLCTLKRLFCHCECSKSVFFHIFDADGEKTDKAISKEFRMSFTVKQQDLSIIYYIESNAKLRVYLSLSRRMADGDLFGCGYLFGAVSRLYDDSGT